VVGRGVFDAGVLKKTYEAWPEALNDVGSALRDFRSRRQPDYGVAKAVEEHADLAPGSTLERAAFGMPIQFRFRSLGWRGPKVSLSGGEGDRRGSPLFLTLERLKNGQLAVVWCLFRSALTPGGHIRVGGRELRAPALGIIEELLKQWRFHSVTE